MKSLFSIVFLLITFNFQAQMQIGQDIDGDVANDRCGFKVASSEDGNRIAISYQTSYSQSNDFGKVKVFDWNGSNWIETGLFLPDTTDNSAYQFGTGIALSNDGYRLAIGSVGGLNTSGQIVQGKVEVYEWINNTWQQIGSTIVGGFNDGTGFSVALSGDGNILVVPAFQLFFIGKINTFVWDDGTTEWEEFGGDLFEFDVTDTSNFGQSVDLSNDGSYMIVGAPASTEFGDNSGAAFYYQRNITDSSWDRIDFFTGSLANQQLGWDVAISGDGSRFAYSSNGFVPDGNGGNNGDEGNIEVYDYINNTITPVGSPIVGGSTSEGTGGSMDLSLDGNKLIYGNPFEMTVNFGVIVGKNWNGSIWETIGNPILGENIEDRFGSSTAISGNGVRFIGGSKLNSEQALESGHVRVYEISNLSASNFIATSALQVYPNPTSQFVFLDDPEMIFTKAHVYDLAGRFLGIERIKENKIDLQNYPIGVLMLQVEHKNTVYSTKIVKF